MDAVADLAPAVRNALEGLRDRQQEIARKLGSRAFRTRRCAADPLAELRSQRMAACIARYRALGRADSCFVTHLPQIVRISMAPKRLSSAQLQAHQQRIIASMELCSTPAPVSTSYDRISLEHHHSR